MLLCFLARTEGRTFLAGESPLNANCLHILQGQPGTVCGPPELKCRQRGASMQTICTNWPPQLRRRAAKFRPSGAAEIRQDSRRRQTVVGDSAPSGPSRRTVVGGAEERRRTAAQKSNWAAKSGQKVCEKWRKSGEKWAKVGKSGQKSGSPEG